MSQAGLGKPACQYSGAEFRQRAKGLAKRLGEPVERLAALCEALANTNASRSQKPKLPARLLRDASADGGLETALKALDANQRKNVNEEALQCVEKAWLQAGLTQEKRICFDTTVDARNRRELTTIAKAMSCSIVDDEASATHIVFFNPAVDAIVDESEYLRTLVVDDARHLALVHWWYRPDSSDEWIPLERVEGAPPPLKDVDAWARPSLTQGGQPWRVCCRFLRDAKAHNEFGDERDYVEEEEVRVSASYAIFMNRLRERGSWVVPFSILGPFGPSRMRRIVVVKMASSRDHRDAVVTITRASARRVKGSRRRRDAVVVSTRESTRCARESKRLHAAATPSTRPSESFNAGGRARADKTGAEEGPEAQEARGPAAP